MKKSSSLSISPSPKSSYLSLHLGQRRMRTHDQNIIKYKTDFRGVQTGTVHNNAEQERKGSKYNQVSGEGGHLSELKGDWDPAGSVKDSG